MEVWGLRFPEGISRLYPFQNLRFAVLDNTMSIAFLDLLTLTCRSLQNNLLRSALTTLGVYMGVTAVSATLQVGAISQAVIAQRLAERDAPQVTILPRRNPGRADRVRFQLQDLEFLRQRLDRVHSISGANWAGTRNVFFQNREAQPSMMAITQEYAQTSGKQPHLGRFFSKADFNSFRAVAIIDTVLANQLFEDQSPIGQRVYISRQPYIIIGVVPSNPTIDDEPDQGEVWVPMAFFSALTGRQDIGSIRIRPDQIPDLQPLAKRTETLMQQRFPGQKFYVWNNIQDILEQQAVLQVTAQALAAVGAIALLVGGVGIANIMIAAVTERTSEIGLRRAIGATQQEIMIQFILEAVILSLVGGLSAIATVHGLTLLVAQVFKLPYQFRLGIAGLSLGSALLVGVGASFLPALRASQLDPVKALRAE
jgi:putative ABC transport system permease protein